MPPILQNEKKNNNKAKKKKKKSHSRAHCTVAPQQEVNSQNEQSWYGSVRVTRRMFLQLETGIQNESELIFYVFCLFFSLCCSPCWKILCVVVGFWEIGIGRGSFAIGVEDLVWKKK